MTSCILTLVFWVQNDSRHQKEQPNARLLSRHPLQILQRHTNAMLTHDKGILRRCTQQTGGVVGVGQSMKFDAVLQITAQKRSATLNLGSYTPHAHKWTTSPALTVGRTPPCPLLWRNEGQRVRTRPCICSNTANSYRVFVPMKRVRPTIETSISYVWATYPVWPIITENFSQGSQSSRSLRSD